MGKRLDYVVLLGISMDINEALGELRKKIFEAVREDYKLLGGASIAIDNGCFVVAQTLTKEVDAHD